MKLITVIGTTILSLSLTGAVYAQEQHDQQDEQKDKSAQEEKKAQPEKQTKPEEKNAQQEKEKNARPEEKNAPEHAQAKPERARYRGPHSGGSLQGELWARTHFPGQPRRLSESPVPIWRLLVWIWLALAEQLALHAGCLCSGDWWNVLPVQSSISGSQRDAKRNAIA
jgi:hypothetical protein